MAEPIVIGDTGARNKRVFILLGAAAALILAVVVLPGLLFGGGGGGEDEFAFPPVVVTTTTVPVDAPAETYETFSDKNPFTPLFDPDGGATGSNVATSNDVTGTTSTIPAQEGSFTFPDEGPPPTLPPGFGESPTTIPPEPGRPSDRVSVLEVYTDFGGNVVASVRVNDTTHEVAEGDEFATSYRVLDLDLGNRCGQFLYGDDRFGLCEGEEAQK